MNPDTNRLEALKEIDSNKSYKDNLHDALQGLFDNDLMSTLNGVSLVRPDGSPVPKHWAIFQVGELVVLKDYTFKIAYMNDGTIVLEPIELEINNRLSITP